MRGRKRQRHLERALKRALEYTGDSREVETEICRTCQETKICPGCARLLHRDRIEKGGA